MAGLGGVVVALAALAAYWPSLDFDFAWLDRREIVEGALVVGNWREAVGLFFDDRNWGGYHRPLYNLIHSFDLALWGLDPGGFHLSSVALHAACGALALSLMSRLGVSTLPALLTALVFVLHPVNSAVAGLIHAKADLLATAFLLGAGRLALVRGRAALCGSLVCFAGALLSKETAFAYPLLVAVVPWLVRLTPEARRRQRGYLSAVGALAAVFLVLRVAGGSAHAVPGPGLGVRAATFVGVYAGYVRRLLLPLDPSVCDTVTAFDALSANARAWSLATFASLVVLQVAVWRTRPELRKWIAAFDLALLPVAQLVPILHFRADRFLYLPSLALAGLCFEGLWRAFVEHHAERSRSRRTATLAFVAGGLAMTLACILGLARRLPELRDDRTLFEAEVARTPDYREGLAVLALHHQRAGRPELAQPLFERALASYPGRLSYLHLDGTLLAYSNNLLMLERIDRARSVAEAAAAASEDPHMRLEHRYNAAVAAHTQGDHAAALEGFRAYRAAHPGDAGCLFLMARSAAALGQRELARELIGAYLRLPEQPHRARVEALLARLGSP